MSRKNLVKTTAVLIAAALIVTAAGQAAEAPRAGLKTYTLMMGSPANDLMLSSDSLSFQAGQLYKLKIVNKGAMTHYFVPNGFDTAVVSEDLSVKGGKVADKRVGVVTRTRLRPASGLSFREIELRPGGEVQWTFRAQTPGRYNFRCGIPSHDAAGMHGSLVITGGLV